jgi:hypothetical protein
MRPWPFSIAKKRRVNWASRQTRIQKRLMSLKILYGALMLLRRRARFEGPKIAALAGLGLTLRE